MLTTASVHHIATARAYVVLPAQDLGRARHFYHETLGFCVEDVSGVRQFLVHAGGETRILVYERERANAEHATATLIVEDLGTVMDDMHERGVQFEEYDLSGLKTERGVTETPGGKGAWFTDTEGNIISVMQMPGPLGGMLTGEPICV